jgi:hypothetical protein
MITPNIVSGLQDAAGLLQFANNELQKPSQQVVSIATCMDARNAMRRMMQQYLMAHNFQTEDLVTLTALKDACSVFNPKFKDTDFRYVECRDEDHDKCNENYCLSIEHVANCVGAANQIKETVFTEFNIH